MIETEEDHPHTNYRKDSPDRRPYWKRVHRDWKVWVAVLLMLAAMAVYLRSNDLSVRPDSRLEHPVP